MIFLQKLAVVTSFCVHFWKWECGLLRDAHRGEGECAFCLKGWKDGRVLVLENQVHTQVLIVWKSCFWNLSVFTSISRIDTLPSPPSPLSQRHTFPQIGERAAVTHVPIYKSVHKMMSQQRCMAWPISAKNICRLLSFGKIFTKWA